MFFVSIIYLFVLILLNTDREQAWLYRAWPPRYRAFFKPKRLFLNIAYKHRKLALDRELWRGVASRC